jgi:hypothetical protein
MYNVTVVSVYIGINRDIFMRSFSAVNRKGKGRHSMKYSYLRITTIPYITSES